MMYHQQISGFPLSLNLNSVTADAEVNAGWGRRFWGADQWGAYVNTDAFPNGIGMSFTLGSVSIDSETNTGWGRNTWNSGSWGTFGDELPNRYSNVRKSWICYRYGIVNVGWGRKNGARTMEY